MIPLKTEDEETELTKEEKDRIGIDEHQREEELASRQALIDKAQVKPTSEIGEIAQIAQSLLDNKYVKKTTEIGDLKKIHALATLLVISRRYKLTFLRDYVFEYLTLMKSYQRKGERGIIEMMKTWQIQMKTEGKGDDLLKKIVE